jgi:enoyl-CoA hydratase
MTNLVQRRDEGGAATLTLNRPEKLNALTVPMFEELRAHVDAIEREYEKIGLVILRGAGKCFSAGHDLADLAAGEHPPAPHFQGETITRLANLPQPVLTAVHGHCYTGALELALAGDLIIAAESARFSDTHAKWAVMPYWGMSQRLPRRVGLAKAREMMLTCRTYTGGEAAAFGLVNACVLDERFDEEIAALAKTILAQSWFTHRANKKMLMETDGVPISLGLSHEILHNEGVSGPDMQARIQSFSKRTK